MRLNFNYKGYFGGPFFVLEIVIIFDKIKKRNQS